MSEQPKELPGPRPGFILGNLTQIGAISHLTWTKWSSMYGPIYRIDLGPMGDGVVLNNHDAFKKGFEEESSDAFGGRFEIPVVKMAGLYGSLTWENDEVHEKRKKLFYSIFGKLDLNKLMQNEVNALCNVLGKSQSKPPDTVYQLIYDFNLSMTAGFCFQRGRGCPYDDPKFREFVKYTKEMLEFRKKLMGEPANILQCMWSTCKYNKFRRNQTNLVNYIGKELTARENENEAVTAIQDIMDGYLAKVDGIEFPAKDSILQSIALIPTANSLKLAFQWIIVMITKHPEVQTKIQEEVTSVLGDKTPMVDDLEKLPYTNAAIYETLRCACPVPQIVPHMMKADAKLEGYDIKKGTVIFGNLWGAHHDPKHWDDPWTFKPERFLNSEGKLDRNKDSYFPFGLGTRKCPAEEFSYKVMFLFVASIYQRYGFETVPGESLPEINGSEGPFNPPPYKLKIVTR